MSIEEEARKANLKFWRLGDDLSGSDEEAEEAVADEVGEEAVEAAADEVDSESDMTSRPKMAMTPKQQWRRRG
jgi:hypothetical protein